VGFVMDKAALGQVLSEYFGFPCQSFHQFFHHHHHPALAQQAIGDRSAEWTQLVSNPHYTNKKITYPSNSIIQLFIFNRAFRIYELLTFIT
jgi:hypothetical protein